MMWRDSVERSKVLRDVGQVNVNSRRVGAKWVSSWSAAEPHLAVCGEDAWEADRVISAC